jgi:transcription initiation factor TFIIIB Brf1 subunit/transcription initiation factor TFIIB
MKNVCELRECPDCASSNVICDGDREQLICKDCGLIFEPLAPEEEEKFEKTHNISLAETKSKPKKAAKKAAKKSASKKKKK